MHCDICGSATLRELEPTTPAGGDWYACANCLATFIVNLDEHYVGRPPYMPINDRWCSVEETHGPATITHASIGNNTTLCGLNTATFQGQAHSWSPHGPEACNDCHQVALRVDALWPLDKRGRADRPRTRIATPSTTTMP
ncbi:hypothetical protein [Actinomadura rupiterrae]|uniref:hypothetical protein n=1 Tax=Actinomadura rupiterrae TaxID=559627 RepID=UPI0020A357A2|nr:hypothetical protein [Actinomadura rupiterrae]MCP2337371.1 hypothetical protein [Actinomadura rupiterrae]